MKVLIEKVVSSHRSYLFDSRAKTDLGRALSRALIILIDPLASLGARWKAARYGPDKHEVCRSLRGRKFFPDYARCLSSESNGLSGSLANISLHTQLFVHHDYATSHKRSSLMQFIVKELRSQIIGYDGVKDWPKRSPDLTPLDFYLRRRRMRDLYLYKFGSWESRLDVVQTSSSLVTETMTFGIKFIFMDDNVLRIQLVNEYFKTKGIQEMVCPARCLNLNPIEHVQYSGGKVIVAHLYQNTELRCALGEK
ncbi:hypothetical protein TNCV_5062391 [Trichonephila clavipes]|nr:hypothetical protein TNCV_5062391 [Trichonephila clavipes]